MYKTAIVHAVKCFSAVMGKTTSAATKVASCNPAIPFAVVRMSSRPLNISMTPINPATSMVDVFSEKAAKLTVVKAAVVDMMFTGADFPVGMIESVVAAILTGEKDSRCSFYFRRVLLEPKWVSMLVLRECNHC